MSYMKYCVRENYTVKEALEVIDANQDRVALVLDKNDKVVAVVSQGDILRSLAGGGNLYAQVATIVRPSFMYLAEKDMEKAYKMFKKTQITMLPIVDEDFHLVEVLNLQDIYEYLENR